MTSTEKKYHDLKECYVENYKRVNNKLVFLKYEKGWVYIKGEGDLSESKIRIFKFEEATNALGMRKDYSAPKKHEKLTFTQTINESDIRIEDGGTAKIVDTLYHNDNSDDESGVFLKMISNCQDKTHLEFNKFVGRKIKITIETID